MIQQCWYKENINTRNWWRENGKLVLWFCDLFLSFLPCEMRVITHIWQGWLNSSLRKQVVLSPFSVCNLTLLLIILFSFLSFRNLLLAHLIFQGFVASSFNIGKGNGNPLRCSCLENPRDGGAWWAAVYGVAQSWTWLKWFSNLAVFDTGLAKKICLGFSIRCYGIEQHNNNFALCNIFRSSFLER